MAQVKDSSAVNPNDQYDKLSSGYMQAMRSVTLNKCSITLTLIKHLLLLEKSMSYAGICEMLPSDMCELCW